MFFRRAVRASSRGSVVLLVGLGVAAAGCASLEPLPEQAAPAAVPFDDASPDTAAGDVGTLEAVPADDGVTPEPEPAAEPETPVDTSGTEVASLLPSAADLGPNWTPNTDVVFTITEATGGEGECAITFRETAAEVVDGPEAFSVSSGTIVVNSVAARMNSTEDADALMQALVARDAVSCDGDPNAIVFAEQRNGADVMVGWAIQLDGGQGPLESGVSVVRKGDLVAIGSVLAEAGVHDVESVLWALTDTAVAKMPS